MAAAEEQVRIAARLAVREQGILEGPVHPVALFSAEDTTVADAEDQTEWLRDPIKVLNAIQPVTAVQATVWFEQVRFQGFNKKDFLDSWIYDHGFSMNTLIKVAFIAAVRGTNINTLGPLLSLPLLAIPRPDVLVSALATGANAMKVQQTRRSDAGRKAVTMARCIAVVPHVVAAMLKQCDVPARVLDCECPAYLQFPAAASIPFNPAMRAAHRDFHEKFSLLIAGGRTIVPETQTNIYEVQVRNGIRPLIMPGWVLAELRETLAPTYVASLPAPASAPTGRRNR